LGLTPGADFGIVAAFCRPAFGLEPDDEATTLKKRPRDPLRIRARAGLPARTGIAARIFIRLCAVRKFRRPAVLSQTFRHADGSKGQAALDPACGKLISDMPTTKNNSI
jgi:hypothetical protein